MSLRKLVAAAMIALGGCGGATQQAPTPQQATVAMPPKPIVLQSAISRHPTYKAMMPETQRELDGFHVFESEIKPLSLDFAQLFANDIAAKFLSDPAVQREGATAKNLHYIPGNAYVVDIVKFCEPDTKAEESYTLLKEDLEKFIGRELPSEIIFPKNVDEIVYAQTPKIYVFEDCNEIIQTIDFKFESEKGQKWDISPLTRLGNPLAYIKRITRGDNAGQAVIIVNKSKLPVYGTYQFNIAGELLHSTATTMINAKLIIGSPQERTEIIFKEERFIHAIEAAWIQHFALRHPEVPQDAHEQHMLRVNDRNPYKGIIDEYNRIVSPRVTGESTQDYCDRIQANARWALEEFLEGNW